MQLADAASANRAGNQPKRQEDPETVRTSLQEALSEIRNISVGLALPELERLSLRDTIHSAVRDHTRRTNTAVAADIDPFRVTRLMPSKLRCSGSCKRL